MGISKTKIYKYFVGRFVKCGRLLRRPAELRRQGGRRRIHYSVAASNYHLRRDGARAPPKARGKFIVTYPTAPIIHNFNS